MLFIAMVASSPCMLPELSAFQYVVLACIEKTGEAACLVNCWACFSIRPR